MEAIIGQINIIKSMNLKVNYSELARKYGVSRDTIRKYNNGYKGKTKTRKRESKLDKHKEEIEAKLKIVGVNISSVYRYIYEKDKSIGSESNFRKYVKRKNLKVKESKKVHSRYETAPGMQLQYDFKEDIEMTSKKGEKFKFNIFAGTLGYSRLSCFEYCKRKTREDVIRSLTNIFVQIQGVTRECLTDNMACIVKEGKFAKEFIEFAKDFNFQERKCRVRSPETKGKIESKNRFMNWLKPYNYEFETEQELIEIIKKIEKISNEKINETTGISPTFLYEKEKRYLQPLPNNKIIENYNHSSTSAKVNNESLISYKRCKYSVPPNYISKTVKIKEEDRKIYIFYNNRLIRQHEISKNPLNYNKDDYRKICFSVFKDEDIEEMIGNNLKMLDSIGGYKDE